MTMSGRAYAKINLGLRIHGKRPDGYHEIETVFHRIGLADEITLTRSDRILIECSDPAIPSDERNLCHRAASHLQRATGTTEGVRISLKKNIPAGAGLGGGSSDAALVLRMLPKFWSVPVERGALHSIAASLGSDIPFFLGESSAHGTGRGDILDFHHLSLPYTIVLCFPGTIVSTHDAYASVTRFTDRSPGRLWDDLRSFLEDTQDCSLIMNDFEGPVLGKYPEIAAVKHAMIAAGARCASLSGSGSSVYGLFDTHESAVSAAGALSRAYPLIHLTPPSFKHEPFVP